RRDGLLVRCAFDAPPGARPRSYPEDIRSLLGSSLPPIFGPAPDHDVLAGPGQAQGEPEPLISGPSDDGHAHGQELSRWIFLFAAEGKRSRTVRLRISRIAEAPIRSGATTARVIASNQIDSIQLISPGPT